MIPTAAAQQGNGQEPASQLFMENNPRQLFFP